MAEYVDKSYYVKVDAAGIGGYLTATFDELRFTQTTTSGVSNAILTFKIKMLHGSNYLPEDIPKKLAADRDITFQIFNRTGVPQTMKHHHVYVPHSSSFSGYVGGAFIVSVLTEEARKSDMRIVAKSRAHQNDLVSSTVESILKENGFQDLMVEETQSILEFRTLRQPWISDYDFVIGECDPRGLSSSGTSGYRLFSPDGLKGCWTTLGYKAKEKEILKSQLSSVTPARNNMCVVDGGAVNREHRGFDLDKKKPSTYKKDPSVTPSFGKVGMYDKWEEGLMVRSVPYSTEDAVKATATRGVYANRFRAYPLTAKFRGSQGWDEVPYKFKVPLLHEKGGGSVVGYADTIIHTVIRGKYDVEIKGLRDSVNVL